MAIKLIVGLGNPGTKYQFNRHNAGFLFLDYIAQQRHLEFKADKNFHSQIVKTHIAYQPVYLLKPQTFVNKSGQAILAVMQFFKIKLDELLVVHDELDLPLVSVKLKYSGGHGGHNGLRDIISHLLGTDFYRLRLGIGRPDTPINIADFVLQDFSQAQYTIFTHNLVASYQVLEKVITGNLSEAAQALKTRT